MTFFKRIYPQPEEIPNAPGASLDTTPLVIGRHFFAEYLPSMKSVNQQPWVIYRFDKAIEPDAEALVFEVNTRDNAAKLINEFDRVFDIKYNIPIIPNPIITRTKKD